MQSTSNIHKTQATSTQKTQESTKNTLSTSSTVHANTCHSQKLSCRFRVCLVRDGAPLPLPLHLPLPLAFFITVAGFVYPDGYTLGYSGLMKYGPLMTQLLMSLQY